MTGFVFLDKAEGITSFVAAAKMRRIFETKKAGHTGTLDPMATGVMVVALGGATRFIELIESHDKAYRASFKLGTVTDTLDITGKVLEKREVAAKKEDVENVLSLFRGEINQLPPMYSAIKKDGVRLYELARKGIEIEREKRPVTVLSLELVSFNEQENEYTIDVECSSGTYIRSLISDIGEKLSCGAVMTSLKRTKANGIGIDCCFSQEELISLKEEGNLEKALVKVDELLTYDKIWVSEAQAKRFSNGGELDTKRLKGKNSKGCYRVYSPENVFLGVGEIDQEGNSLSVKRVFREGDNVNS